MPNDDRESPPLWLVRNRQPPPDREQALRLALALVPEPVPDRHRGTWPMHTIEEHLRTRSPGDEPPPGLLDSIALFLKRDGVHQRNRGRLGAVLWAARHLGVQTAMTACRIWGWPPEVPLPASFRVRRSLVEHWPYGWRLAVNRYAHRRALEAAQGILEEPGAEPDLSW